MNNDSVKKFFILFVCQQCLYCPLLLQYEMLRDDYQSAISRVDDLGLQLNNEMQRNAVLRVSSQSLTKTHFYFIVHDHDLLQKCTADLLNFDSIVCQ